MEELFSEDPRSGDPIALIDDNVISASQSFAQIAAWLDIPRDQWPADIIQESNIDNVALHTESREKLLATITAQKLGLCVAIGSVKQSQANRDELIKLINKIGSTAQEDQRSLFGELSEISIPLFKGRDITNVTEPVCFKNKEFMKFLSDVGASSLAWSKYGKDLRDLPKAQRKQCIADSLGYGGAQGMIFTFRNVPVSSLTCLWAPGKYNDLPWMPLGLRRGYGKKVILT